MSAASLRSRPLLVFDGDCRFCRRWIYHWKTITGERVEYLPYQDPRASAALPEVSKEEFKTSIQYLGVDGTRASGAEAVFRAQAHANAKKWKLWCYKNIPGLGWISEQVYRIVASQRTFFSFMTNILYGDEVEKPSYILSQNLFLRFLGLIYFFAFLSLWTQIVGLSGRDGIVPAADLLEAIRSQSGGAPWYTMPTLFWLGVGDSILRWACGGGAVVALFATFGFLPAVTFALLWITYLSIFMICQPFLGYQWDILLLEAGFLAIFVSPLSFFLRTNLAQRSNGCVLFLIRWLLFRLMFQSGCVKLLSGDIAWKNLTALSFHYETQPLPTWIGWFLHQFPASLHTFSTLGMFAVELLIPFLVIAPRRLRVWAFLPFVLFQLFIMLTGNYAFFNLLTIALCLSLLDDQSWPSRLRVKWFYLQPTKDAKSSRMWPKWVVGPIAAILLILSGMSLTGMFYPAHNWPKPIVQFYRLFSPYLLVNSYGLFAVMTTSRPEVIVEGSQDGKTWSEYEFRYKAGRLDRRPRFVAPHQPRLDWQMWFAALGSCQNNRWFLSFSKRLLEGSNAVENLLRSDPFPNSPPRYLRSTLYDYKFTTWDEKKVTGHWWKREKVGQYCPNLSAKSFRYMSLQNRNHTY